MFRIFWIYMICIKLWNSFISISWDRNIRENSHMSQSNPESWESQVSAYTLSFPLRFLRRITLRLPLESEWGSENKFDVFRPPSLVSLQPTIVYCLLIFRNNSSVNKKKSKKGFVKDFTNNNLAGTPPTPPPGFQDSTILARYTEEIII